MLSKAVILVYNTRSRDFSGWHRQIMGEAVPLLLETGAQRLKVGVTRSRPPRLTLLPLKPYPLAMFSIWAEDGARWHDYIDALNSLQGEIAAYAVSESVPVAYHKDWPDGTESPGVVLLTLLKQNPRLDYDMFIQEWHNRHTPMAVRIHPLWQYIRNVVEERLTPTTPDYQGIVEEHFYPRSNCLNPIRMFGGGFRALLNMVIIYRHVSHFLDLSGTHNFLLNEIHIQNGTAVAPDAPWSEK